jgi:dihydroxyacetone kinase DhaKLM complex PTS-EIIA-like component DhaM
MKLPKINIGKLLATLVRAAKPVAKAAAPLVVGAIAASVQAKVGRAAERISKKL